MQSGDLIEALYMLHPLTGEIVQKMDSVPIFPAASSSRSSARPATNSDMVKPIPARNQIGRAHV